MPESINTVLSAQAMAVLKSLDHYNGRRFSKISDSLEGIVGTKQRGNCAITRIELKRALDYLCRQGLIELEPLRGGDFAIVKKREGEMGASINEK